MRVYNFSSGPAMLPLSVLERAASEMCEAGGTGQSVMEMSHRSREYRAIIERTESLLREAMDIPANYKVLFLQGGASLQFAMVPLNLAAVPHGGKLRRASLVDTGVWTKKALEEGSKYVNLEVRASSKDSGYRTIPSAPSPNPSDYYYYICHNNTIFGTRWNALPETGKTPLVADISSSILSEPIPVRKFGVLFAGAQKNLGQAGVTVVIIREDLIGHAPQWVPVMLRYDTHANEGSLYNTPPCYSIYVMSLVLEWFLREGGISAAAKRNEEKARLLYDFLDKSALWKSSVQPPYRSLMNVCFSSGDSDIDSSFVQEAEKAGLINLAGHRLAGGLRASIYNAMPIEGVEKLVAALKGFEAERQPLAGKS